MARTPFTQSVIHDILEDTGVISMDLIMDRLPDWDEKEIKQRLSGWRYRGAIDYKLVNGELEDFEILRNKKPQAQAGGILSASLGNCRDYQQAHRKRYKPPESYPAATGSHGRNSRLLLQGTFRNTLLGGQAMELVYMDGRKEPYTTSEIIAECAGVQHHTVTRLLRNHKERFEAFGFYGFEIHKLDGKGRPRKVYHLNEQQATLLITYLDNTPQVVKLQT